MIRKLFRWFERKLLKITYCIGVDYSIRDYSTIIIIRVNNRTGQLEVMSSYNDES